MATKTTNLDKVKEVLRILLRIDPKPCEECFAICYHPFTNSSHACDENRNMLNLLDPDDFQKWVELMDKAIDGVEDVFYATILINPAYLLVFLKYVKPYLSIEDFSKLLCHCWTTEEDPSQDKNVKLRTVVSWFKQAKKEYMMDENEMSYLNSLPDEVTVYRGVARHRARGGLSWTANLDTATWFAHRFDSSTEKGYILKATVPKSIPKFPSTR